MRTSPNAYFENRNVPSPNDVYDFIVHDILENEQTRHVLKRDGGISLPISESMARHLQAVLAGSPYAYERVHWPYPYDEKDKTSVRIILIWRTPILTLEMPDPKPYCIFTLTKEEMLSHASSNPILAIVWAAAMSMGEVPLYDKRQECRKPTPEEQIARGHEPGMAIPYGWIYTEGWHEWLGNHRKQLRIDHHDWVGWEIIRSTKVDTDCILHDVRTSAGQELRIFCRGNVSYSKPLSLEEVRESSKLLGVYRASWSEHDPEWQDCLIGKFWEYFKWKHRFFILFGYQGATGSEKIIGSLRATPYSSPTDPHAEYLGACNVSNQYGGYGLLRYMVQDYFDNPTTLANEVYIHAISDSPTKELWKRLGFADIKEEVIPYGEIGRSMKLTLMYLTREKFEALKEV